MRYKTRNYLCTYSKQRYSFQPEASSSAVLGVSKTLMFTQPSLNASLVFLMETSDCQHTLDGNVIAPKILSTPWRTYATTPFNLLSEVEYGGSTVNVHACLSLAELLGGPTTCCNTNLHFESYRMHTFTILALYPGTLVFPV
jgi:hypothetical protein